MTPDIDLWDAVLTYEASKRRCWEQVGWFVSFALKCTVPPPPTPPVNLAFIQRAQVVGFRNLEVSVKLCTSCLRPRG